MEEYGSYNWNQQGNEPQNNTPMEPKKPHGKNNKNAAKWAKKIGAVALSAVLFGGVAGGVFTGVTYATGATAKAKATQTESDSSQQTTTTKLQTATASTSTASSTSSGSMDVTSIVQSAMPSIVAITNKSVQEVQNYFSMFSRGGGTQEQEVESQGSGIIIGQNDSELLIATNNHVVEGADTLSVCFADDNACEATVKGTDSDNDLAVIAVKLSDISDDTMSKIKIAEIGDSNQLQVGEQVVAIGNALGYGQSVTTGIVSAVNRQLEDSNSENGFIQTDAAINPGNSGGALLNMQGQVIGINSAKLASTEVEGMGYAIPVSTASPIFEDLMNRQTRTKVSSDQAAALGIKGQTVDSSIAEAYGIPQGVYVAEIEQGSAAEKAGITAGSVITKFDDTTIESMDDLKSCLEYYAAGETVDLVVKIADNGSYVEKTLTITLDKADTSTTTQDGQQGQTQPGASGQDGNLQGSILK
ncbi:S1C family serine protease [Blautia faecicola]|uniref:Trypsin-like serine protease n=1 Tax=Blautia faecicola TaxID=2509240 RepID=A0A4Q1RGJ3_9FIRM|nr:trypsin-like peptidase domain-containing protein [Blautia faecicola]RXS74747.1 trypsin-like serine protease [Blautia faecicola]